MVITDAGLAKLCIWYDCQISRILLEIRILAPISRLPEGNHWETKSSVNFVMESLASLG